MELSRDVRSSNHGSASDCFLFSKWGRYKFISTEIRALTFVRHSDIMVKTAIGKYHGVLYLSAYFG